MFLRDDDDGDLSNGTPHIDVLRAAAERHALLFAIDGGGGGGGGGGACAHDVCAPGEPLDPTCDPCVAQVCQIDDFCCAQAWDEQCALGAEQVCDAPCGGGGGGGDPAQCDACTNELCSLDPYCCIVEWDQQCAAEAQELCGQVCS